MFAGALLAGAVVDSLVLWFVDANAGDVEDTVLLPLPPPLVLVGRAQESCGQGNSVGGCSLQAAIHHADAMTDPVPLLRDHLVTRGWTIVGDQPGFVIAARRGDPCLRAEDVGQMEDRLRPGNPSSVHYVEGTFGLPGGLPAATGRRLLFVTVVFDACR